ncbi:MAG: hypothetical protein KY455_09050 [Euryarchaeota archaeon]|nr:hypothetical protein [Euryarchaeota archaeon]
MASLSIPTTVFGATPGPHVQYTPDEGIYCTMDEILGKNDFDGDGTPDCKDNDDDNDGLTDEFEDRYIGNGAHIDLDHDNDGVLDQWDLLPSDRNGKVQVDFLVGTWRDQSDGCDIDHSPADPYMWDLEVRKPGGSKAVKIPKEWKEGANMDDSTIRMPSSAELGIELFQASADIHDWEGVNGQALEVASKSQQGTPTFALYTTMKDQDLFDYDNFIMLDGASAAGLLDIRLGTSQYSEIITGSGTCAGKIDYQVTNNVKARQVQKALLALLGELVTTGNSSGAIGPD